MNIKKKLIIVGIVFLAILLTFQWKLNPSFDSTVENMQKGVWDVGNLVGDQQAWYNRYKFEELNCIATNETYGTFVLKKDGYFIYYPEENIFDSSEDRVKKYTGIWFYNFREMKFTVLQTYYNKLFFNSSNTKKEFFTSFGYDNSETFNFNDDLIISDNLFKLQENELTKNSNQKLKLESTIIENYIKLKK